MKPINGNQVWLCESAGKIGQKYPTGQDMPEPSIVDLKLFRFWNCYSLAGNDISLLARVM